MTFWFPSWRSLNLWNGHLTIPKRSPAELHHIPKNFTTSPKLQIIPISMAQPMAFHFGRKSMAEFGNRTTETTSSSCPPRDSEIGRFGFRPYRRKPRSRWERALDAARDINRTIFGRWYGWPMASILVVAQKNDMTGYHNMFSNNVPAFFFRFLFCLDWRHVSGSTFSCEKIEGMKRGTQQNYHIPGVFPRKKKKRITPPLFLLVDFGDASLGSHHLWVETQPTGGPFAVW